MGWNFCHHSSNWNGNESSSRALVSHTVERKVTPLVRDWGSKSACRHLLPLSSEDAHGEPSFMLVGKALWISVYLLFGFAAVSTCVCVCVFYVCRIFDPGVWQRLQKMITGNTHLLGCVGVEWTYQGLQTHLTCLSCSTVSCCTRQGQPSKTCKRGSNLANYSLKLHRGCVRLGKCGVNSLIVPRVVVWTLLEIFKNNSGVFMSHFYCLRETVSCRHYNSWD